MYFDRYAEDRRCLPGGAAEVPAIRDRVVLYAEGSGGEEGAAGHGWSQNQPADHQVAAGNHRVCAAAPSDIAVDNQCFDVD